MTSPPSGTLPGSCWSAVATWSWQRPAGAASALDAVERYTPEAVLLDIHLGDDDGFDVCRRLTRARPGLAVLLASTSEYEHWGEEVASSGARGFVSKAKLLDADFGQFWPSAGRCG
jgi:DNA-binding NarL/FixJ family response regulator